jgi:membrane fusion protein (multidrug efflux system)
MEAAQSPRSLTLDHEEVQVPAPRRSRAKVVLPVLLLLAAAVGGVKWARGRGLESTDDAQVEGHIVNVAARVSGTVGRVLVADNQRVEAGAVLVELDAADLDARLAVARADLAAAQAAVAAARTQLDLTDRQAQASVRQARGGVRQAVAVIGVSRAGIDQARADVTASESRRGLARTELDRVRSLRADGALSQAELDARQSQYDQAAAAVAQAQSRLASAVSGVSSSRAAEEIAQGRMVAADTAPQQVDAARAQVAVAEARVQQMQAALHIAELNRSYATVRAAVAGVVSRRTVEPGMMVGPERALMALVPSDDAWVVANFKEDQVAEMRPGQAVTVRIDAYGSQEFRAHVDSVSAASGARFALLPPDNASGNFTKVVQRIPVLVRFDGRVPVRLAPGMSADVTVRVNR